ncbi:MAG: TonB family protein [Acidobacteriota bacterium]|nr:TonB family protein [Acidobacteriota bacterium]
METLYKIALSLVLVLFLSAGFASAQTELEKGIELYKKDRNKEAISVLEKVGKQKEFKANAEVFNYLGLAYIKNNDLKRARKTLEKTVELDPQNASYRTNLAYAYLLANKLNEAGRESTKSIELNQQNADAYYIRGFVNLRQGKYDEAIADGDKSIAIDSDYSLSYLLKSDALLSNFGKLVAGGAKPADELDLLKQSKEALETCLNNCRNNSQTALQTERLDGVQAFYNYFSRRKDATLTPPGTPAPGVVTPPDPNALKIISKPRASYTDKARQAGITGSITLAVLFSESGRVTHTLILKGLDTSLNAEAVKAARQIVFEPAKENGKPISLVKIVQYNFMIY